MEHSNLSMLQRLCEFFFGTFDFIVCLNKGIKMKNINFIGMNYFNEYLIITSGSLTTFTIEVQTSTLQFFPMMLQIHFDIEFIQISSSIIIVILTMTSFKSFIWSWWRGSKKFCLTLSSSEYFTSAICFRESPNSTNAWAARKSVKK